jgi:hypothetical protein
VKFAIGKDGANHVWRWIVLPDRLAMRCRQDMLAAARRVHHARIANSEEISAGWARGLLSIAQLSDDRPGSASQALDGADWWHRLYSPSGLPRRPLFASRRKKQPSQERMTA